MKVPDNRPRGQLAGVQASRVVGSGLWLLLLVGLVGFGARAWHLGTQSIWEDEGISVLLASKALGDLLQSVIEADIHPPLYYLALHYWMALAGSSEYAVRFLSTAAGFLVVPALYQLARCLLTPARRRTGETIFWPALVAAALATLSPFLVYYSQEARNYILVTLWSVTSSLALWKAQETTLARPRSWRTLRMWLVYVVLATFTIYTNYFGAFVLLAHFLFIIVVSARDRRLPLAGLSSFVGVAILYVPWLKPALAQMLRLQTTPDFWSGSISLQSLVERLFVAFSLGPKAQTGLPILAFFAVMAALGLVSLVRLKTAPLGRSGAYLLLYLLVPLAIVYAITARAPKFTERYLIMASPAFYLLLAGGIGVALDRGVSLLGRGKRLGYVLLLVSATFAAGIFAISGYFTYQTSNNSDTFRDDNRAAVHYVEAYSSPGDVIILMMYAPQGFQYYYTSEVPWFGMQPGDDFKTAAADLNRITQGKERVWLYLWNKEWADPAGFVTDSLDFAAPRVMPDQYFRGVEVRAYSLAERPTFSADFQPQVPTDINFAGKVQLLGFDNPRTAVSPGQESNLTLYWKALQPINEDYVVSVRLKRDGYYWGSRETRPTSYYYPTASWKPGVAVRGKGAVLPLAGTPPGRYQVEVALHTVDPSGPGRDLPILGQGGVAEGTSKVLGQIEVGKPDRAPSSTELGLGEAQSIPFSDQLALLGAQTPARSVRTGDAVPLTIFWKALSKPSYQMLSLWLEDSQGHILPLYNGEPVMGSEHRTSRWDAGEVVRTQYAPRIPARAAPGPAVVKAAFALPDGLGTTTARDVVHLEVQERSRVMNMPEGIQHRLDAMLGSTARLVGYDLSSETVRPGQTLQLVLYWQALRESDTGYTVFTHLLDSQNMVRAQDDNIPVLGTYPTTAWTAGEYIRDEYKLPVDAAAPPGDYSLEVGMYDKNTGQRLPLIDPSGKTIDDRALLGNVRVVP